MDRRSSVLKYVFSPSVGIHPVYKGEVYQKRYIQRDLEDQIKEEQLKRLKQTKMSTEKPKIKVSEVYDLLKAGTPRYGENSIQEKYSLNWSQAKQLFNHPKLKGVRRKRVNSIEIVDDTTTTQENPEDNLFN